MAAAGVAAGIAAAAAATGAAAAAAAAAAARLLPLAAVQAVSTVGRPDLNAARVDELLSSNLTRPGVGGGVPVDRLVLLPEAYMQGYTYDTEVAWRGVDVIEGEDVPHPERAPACAALVALAVAHGAYIGTTVLERVRRAHGVGGRPLYDVLNTFVLAQPDGRLAADRSPKVHPANFETYVFRGGIRNACGRIIRTPLGRLGVGICYDNYHADTLAELAAGAPDVLLLPHCAPSPPAARLGMGAAEIGAMEVNMVRTAARYAAAYAVPVVYTNPLGPFDSPCPAWYLRPLEGNMTRNGVYKGGAQVVAAGGVSIATAPAREPAAVVADVTLPAVSPTPPGAAAAAAPPTAADDAITPSMRTVFPFNEGVGTRWYEAHTASRSAVLDPAAYA